MDAVQGGIIAAGASERFKQQGIQTPKAMIEVAGSTLLEQTVNQFVDAGIMNLTVIFNEESAPICVPWMKQKFPNLNVNFIVKNTASSYESFLEVTARTDGRPTLITTVDSVFKPKTLAHLIQAAKNFPPGSLMLGVTRFIDDEKPLYVQMGEGHKILSLGSRPSEFVTNGVYLLPADLKKSDMHYPALRYFLMDRVAGKQPIYGFDMGKSVDVDHPKDIEVAGLFLSSFKSGPSAAAN